MTTLYCHCYCPVEAAPAPVQTPAPAPTKAPTETRSKKSWHYRLVKWIWDDYFDSRSTVELGVVGYVGRVILAVPLLLLYGPWLVIMGKRARDFAGIMAPFCYNLYIVGIGGSMVFVYESTTVFAVYELSALLLIPFLTLVIYRLAVAVYGAIYDYNENHRVKFNGAEKPLVPPAEPEWSPVPKRDVTD